jgi:hypothetical protein
MVARLLQVRAHLILCFRAEEKIEMVKVDGRTQIVPKQTRTGLDGWVPVCEKNLPYELTMSFLLTADAPGLPKPIKLEAQHRPLFPLNQPITEASGQQLAEWARGGSAVSAPSVRIEPGGDGSTGTYTWPNFWAEVADMGITERTVRTFVGQPADVFDAFNSHDLELLMADLRKAHPQPALPS